MNITDPNIEKYLDSLHAHRDKLFISMEEYARQYRFPIIGPRVGVVLEQLARLIKARTVFEMGSGFGYSALWFARGLADDAKIICTDGSADNRDRAREHFREAGIDSKIEFHVGDARDIIEKYDGPFDIIFNDIDKEYYPDVLDLALPRLRSGGVLLTDNLLWSGRILGKNPDPATAGVLEFNRRLFAEEKLISSVLPLRDGLGIAVKA